MAAIVVMIIFGGFGLVMLYVGLTQYFEQKRLLAGAREIEAEITRSDVHSSSAKDSGDGVGRSGTTTYRPEVEFRYEVGGVRYTSDRIYPTIIAQTHASPERAAEVLRGFPVGAKVRAFVDSTLPDRAFLIAEAGLGPVVFIIIGVLLPPAAWVAGRFI